MTGLQPLAAATRDRSSAAPIHPAAVAASVGSSQALVPVNSYAVAPATPSSATHPTAASAGLDARRAASHPQPTRIKAATIDGCTTGGSVDPIPRAIAQLIGTYTPASRMNSCSVVVPLRTAAN